MVDREYDPTLTSDDEDDPRGRLHPGGTPPWIYTTTMNETWWDREAKPHLHHLDLGGVSSLQDLVNEYSSSWSEVWGDHWSLASELLVKELLTRHIQLTGDTDADDYHDRDDVYTTILETICGFLAHAE